MSIRLTKKEWDTIKSNGDMLFKNRNVGYIQIAETRLYFDSKSPYFKDLKALDDKNLNGDEL